MAEKQEDVLPKKGNVTKAERGLQAWDAPMGEGKARGTGSEGTAERAARITRAQQAAEEE